MISCTCLRRLLKSSILMRSKRCSFLFQHKEHLKFYILIVFFCFYECLAFLLCTCHFVYGFSNGMLFCSAFCQGLFRCIILSGNPFPTMSALCPFLSLCICIILICYISNGLKTIRKKHPYFFCCKQKDSCCLCNCLFFSWVFCYFLVRFLKSYINPLVILHM